MKARPYPLTRSMLHFFAVLLLWACASPTAQPPVPTAPIPQETPTSPPPASPTLRPSPTPTLTPSAPKPSATPGLQLCSPLAGYSREALIEAVSNPFNPPARLGSDDPHQAIDLAVTQYGLALTGEPVLAILLGRAAAVIAGRFPYGNALMVETPLDQLPAGWLAELALPTPAPTLPPHPAMTCPQVENAPAWDSSPAAGRSLYLLYAHLEAPPAYQLGDRLACGAPIGRIGQSGNALNPHVHIELRLGPAGARFISMAHYESRATPEEMSNYCAWRVSGVFQLVDPMGLLGLLP